jgi:hypothetical protein
MNRGLWAVAGLALVSTAGAVALLAASSGGEDEVVQQPASASPTAPATSRAPTPTPGASAMATPIPADTTGTLPVCPPLPATSWVWTPPSPATQFYKDATLGFSLLYPSDWTLCAVGDPPQFHNPVAALNFMDRAGLLHASLWVYPNSIGLGLDDWFKARHGDISREEATVAGQRALFTTVGVDGTVAAATFAKQNLFFELRAAAQEDYDALAGEFRFVKG